jgi:DtxR family transcriptional regulator, Mn-dependent transcriptional regulator
VGMTESLEDYLEIILYLAENTERIRVSDIADPLSVSKPSVHQALHELEDRGFVRHEPYRDVSLTPPGRRAATAVREKHALLKRFLSEFLGVSEANAEKDACAMEHDLSAETITKIRRRLKG